jgi:heme A synthase
VTSIIQLVFIILPALVFLAAAILYPAMFRWRESFQGRSMMGLLVALFIILGLNAVVGLSFAFYGTVAAWWPVVSIGAFTILTIAGIGFCASIIRSRQR